MDALKVGIDTVRINVVAPVDVTAFERVHQSGDGEKSFLKLTRNDGAIRATYYPNQERTVIEASLPKVLYGTNWDVVAGDEINAALAAAVAWLPGMPDVGSWRVLRVDWACDWEIPRGIHNYISALARLSLPGCARTEWKNGVSWRNNSRLIRFYNKSSESGFRNRLDARLRFEVSDQKRGVWYLSQVRGCEPDVQSLVSDGVSRSVLSHWLTKLGVVDGWGAADDVRSQVYALFGRRAAAALEHLHLIQTHGSDAVALGLTSRASYYRYKDQLSHAGLLGSAAGLSALSL
jgi:hypothetical protein